MNKYHLFAYSRLFENETGAAMHLAIKKHDSPITVLNKNFAILFPCCEFDEGGMEGRSKGLVKPWIFRKGDSSFGIVALRRDLGERGESHFEQGRENRVLFFSSPDMIYFSEDAFLPVAPHGAAIEDIQCCYENNSYYFLAYYQNQWHAYGSKDLKCFEPVSEAPAPRNRSALDIWDAGPASGLEISEVEAEKLLERFVAPPMPSDREVYPFPFMSRRGDPMALEYKGGYLFIATDDEHKQNFLKIRQTQRLAEIPGATDHVIFKAPEAGDMSGCIWAPEFHWVKDRLCLFFAAGKPHWYTVQSRIIWLEGEDPLKAENWSFPRRIVKADGSELVPENTITLDMTAINTSTGYYVVWSQRKVLIDPIRCGTADLFIARLNPDQPWKLASEPVVLSRPEYGWERIHSAVNEGAFFLRRGKRIFMTFASALIDATYCTGMMETEDGLDLCDPANWVKNNYPVLHRFSIPGQMGTGHNAFVKDKKGEEVILYHALDTRNYMHDPTDWRRFPAIRPVVWDKSGFPHFDAT